MSLPPRKQPLTGPAIALLELESISRGMVVADALVKRARVRLARSEPVTPGKYLLLFTGEVAEVEEALKAGREVSGPLLLDQMWLPYASQGLLEALLGHFRPPSGESLGIVETHSVAASLLAADAALKAADVWLTAMHLAQGIGGKAYFTLSGPLHMVEAAIERAAASIAPPMLLATELIHNPHPEFLG